MIQLIIKIVTSAISLLIAAWITPGMSISGGFGVAISVAIVIGLLDWLALRFTSLKDSPTGRGSTGFILAAVILYLAGKFVRGFHVNLLGALIGAFILGLVDAIMPWDNKTL